MIKLACLNLKNVWNCWWVYIYKIWKASFYKCCKYEAYFFTNIIQLKDAESMERIANTCDHKIKKTNKQRKIAAVNFDHF